MSEKLSIKDITAAIDMGARDLWNDLSEDQQKSVSFYLLNRYASSIKGGSRETKELAIFKTNEYYNKHFFELSKHPRLLWYLICMTGNEDQKIHFHEWIGHKKKTGNTKIDKALRQFYPDMKDDEIEVLAAITTKKEIKETARDLGYTEAEIKKLV